tara:strand:- start:501 stop:680 length:180 start_codon:yes stop_codon:yes gene_type:complete
MAKNGLDRGLGITDVTYFCYDNGMILNLEFFIVEVQEIAKLEVSRPPPGYQYIRCSVSL